MAESTVIGVISPLLGGFYWSGVLSGIQAAARRHGVQLIAIEGASLQLYRSRLAKDIVAGWILVMETAGAAHLLREGTPVVTISSHDPALACPAVLADNRGGTLAATRHLLDHGYQRIAFIGDLHNHDVEQRYAGYQDALSERGLPLDPALVIAAADNSVVGGHEAAQQLVAAGLPCNAIVVGTDSNALGALEVLRAAGHRIPEDVAITGFDDTEAAQQSVPPLTTVRQKFDILGEVATDLLLEQIGGAEAQRGVQYVPTILMRRRSCGCDATVSTQPAAMIGGTDWREQLALELVRLAMLPAPVEPGAIQRRWPAVEVLVGGLGAAIAGTQEPPTTDLQQACREAVALTADLNTLEALVEQLEQTATKLPGATAHEARARVAVFLKRVTKSITRARLEREMIRIEYLEGLVERNYAVSVTLLRNATDNAPKLGWLREARASWGCLGLWENFDSAKPVLRISETYGAGSIAAGVRFPAPAFPPRDQISQCHEGELIKLIMLRSEGEDIHNIGVLALSAPIVFQLTADRDDTNTWAALLTAAIEREQLLVSLTEQQEVMRAAYERERALADTVRELGSPVIPLLPGVLLVPLVGALSADRAQQVLEAVLEGVTIHQAETVLLDITGVPIVDTQVANSLLQAARATTLLGARVILVGVRPEIAQSIVGLGIDLHHLSTQPTLASALSFLQTR